jgi:hypothetical protein
LNAKKRYGVFQMDRRWLLCCEKYRLSHYSDRLAAISAGKRAVWQAIGSGFDAELYIIGVGGELERIALASMHTDGRVPRAWDLVTRSPVSRLEATRGAFPYDQFEVSP